MEDKLLFNEEDAFEIIGKGLVKQCLHASAIFGKNWKPYRTNGSPILLAARRAPEQAQLL